MQQRLFFLSPVPSQMSRIIYSNVRKMKIQTAMIRYSGGQLPNAFIIHHDPLSVPGKAAMHRQNPALHKPGIVRQLFADLFYIPHSKT